MYTSTKLQLSVFDNSPQPFCVIKVELDAKGAPCDWTFLYCNDALAKLEGYPREELIGKRFFELFPNGESKWLQPYYEAAYENKIGSFESISNEVGQYLYVECFPLDEVGTCGCMLRTSNHEMEYRKQLLTDDSASNLLHVAITSGLWRIEYNEKGEESRCIWTDAFCKILGYSSKKDFPERLDAWYNSIHPDDVGRVREKYEGSLYDYSGRTNYDVEYRMLNKQGEYHWLRDTAHVSRRADGSPIAADGIIMLIDEKHNTDEQLRIALRRAEEANRANEGKAEMLRRTEAFSRNLLGSAACGIISYTLPKHKNIYMNAKALKVFGFCDMDDANLYLADKMRGTFYNDPNVFQELLKLRQTDGSVDYECSISNKSGQRRNLLAHSEVVTNPQGERIVYTTFLDITENRQLQAINDKLETQNGIIAGLSREYTSVWLVTDDGSSCIRFQDSGLDVVTKELDILSGKGSDYAMGMSYYVNKFVCEEDREEVARKIQYEVVQQEIRRQTVYSVVYRRNYQGQKEYFQINFTLAGSKEGTDFVMGYKNVNDAMLAELQKNEALATALAAEERANKAKSLFLANMSHDIRTPINGIVGLLKIDEGHFDDPELIRTNHQKMLTSADHLISLINDVLQVSKMEEGTVELAHEPIDIADMFRDILTILENRAAESGIRLVFENKTPNYHPYIYGSPVHLRQIFLNIYGNCIKYTPTGGKITTVVEDLGEQNGSCSYRWTITDTGIGMSEEFLKRIFEPFVQERNDARSVYHGTGLGMTIVKHLVDKMQGSINISSKEGVGSTFTIILPFEIAEPIKTETQKSVEHCTIEGLRLLLVEDNELNAEIAQFLLEEAGAKITLVCDGKQALRLFRDSEPETFDAILMDVMMPVMDGLTATRAIRSMDREDAKNIPIIAMTANAFKEDAEKCFAAGMNAHLAKPLNLAGVKSTICEQVQRNKKNK